MSQVARFGLVVVLALLTSACDSSPSAPSVSEVGEACAHPSFCLGMPEGWTVTDVGERHVTIEHPAGSDATIGFIDMGRVVESTGGTWPQTAERVSRSLWALFDGGDAELDQVTVRGDGAVRSVGGIATGVQYHLLVPLEDTTAVGIVVRVPSRGWRMHVDAIFDGFRLV